MRYRDSTYDTYDGHNRAAGPDWYNGLTYPWGNTFVAENAVYGDNSGDQTAIVDSNPGGASWVGALDLSANVWERVLDWYGPYSADAVNNPAGPSTGQDRVMRGSSWGVDQYFLHAAYRVMFGPDDWDSDVGFRCARSLE